MTYTILRKQESAEFTRIIEFRFAFSSFTHTEDVENAIEEALYHIRCHGQAGQIGEEGRINAAFDKIKISELASASWEKQ